MIEAVSFDAGQTLVELDAAMLVDRLFERGVAVTEAAIEAALPAAWRHHEASIAAGARHPWRELMTALLDGADVEAERIAGLVAWLRDEQPRRNLWRRPVAGMRDLVEELHDRGVPLAVVSNSEGHLAELLAELGWARWFAVIADSGVLGVAKPDAAIFAWAADRLGVAPAAIVHVGDSREADVEGALGAGMHAIWFGAAARPIPHDHARTCHDAASLRAALAAWGVGG
jgi:HAD superfamily hydrolase (TIGR01509 family)